MKDITENEKILLYAEAYGIADKQLAALRFRSGKTIRYEWLLIRRKLDAFNRTDAVVKSLRLGIIDIDDIKLTPPNRNLGVYPGNQYKPIAGGYTRCC